MVEDKGVRIFIDPTAIMFLIGSEDPECDPREVVDPDDYVRDLTDQAVTQAYRYAQRLPKVPVSRSPKGVVDLYDVTEDWIPIYDRSDLDGFYLCIGTSGNQFKNAPIAGELMADIIEAREKKKNVWVKWFERLGSFYDSRFTGPNWREKDKAFWEEKLKEMAHL